MRAMEIMTDLAACLCAQITVDDSPEPCWCGVMPGQAALLEALGSDQCDGGLAWVRLVTMYPSAAVGVASQQVGNCGSGMGMDLEVGIVRLIAVEEDAPDPAQSLAATEQQMKDAQTALKAIQCCGALGPKDYILGSYTPYGPLGAALGGSWTVYVGL